MSIYSIIVNAELSCIRVRNQTQLALLNLK